MKPTLEGIAPMLQVFDMPKSIAFYRDILGFEVVLSSPARGADDFDWGLLRLNGMELMLNTAYESRREALGAGSGPGRRPPRYGALFRLPRPGRGLRLPPRARPRPGDAAGRTLWHEPVVASRPRRLRDLPPVAGRLTLAARADS
jgi:catechol 2,3-dioxygenase-like lactoylglutathione lyase family enzyme